MPQLKLNEALQNKLNNLDPGMRIGPMIPGVRPPGHMPPGMMPPHFHPNYYQMMQQRFGGMKAPPTGAGGDPMGYRFPPPHPHMPQARLPPPYPGQPHPDMVARQHAMYQRPPPAPDGRHMYPPAAGGGGGMHPPPHHYPHHSLPPPPHGYPPHYQMYPRHPHMPPYPPTPMGAGGVHPPHPALPRPANSGSPVLHSPPLRQSNSPVATAATSSRQTTSPAQSNSQLTSSPTSRRTESPVESSHSNDQPLQQLQGSKVASLLLGKRQGSGDGGSQEEELTSEEKQKRESTSLSSLEDSLGDQANSSGKEKESEGREEKPSGQSERERVEGGDKGEAPVKSAGTEGQLSSAEVMHRQQLEYQRYRYSVLLNKKSSFFMAFFMCVHTDMLH